LKRIHRRDKHVINIETPEQSKACDVYVQRLTTAEKLSYRMQKEIKE